MRVQEPERTTGPQPFVVMGGVLVLRGYSLSLRVERGHLVVRDQTLGVERRSRFSRVDRDLTRIVVIGSSGLLSLDVIEWLSGVGLPLIHVHPDGRVLMVAAPSAAHRPNVRRAQAMAGASEWGLRLSRALLVEKIEGQLAMLDRLDATLDQRREMAAALAAVKRTADFGTLRQAEARAAGAYWLAWRDVSVRFSKTDGKRIPAHWTRFGARHSPLGQRGPIRAINPANAILNYCYALLEAEARIACLAVGLDPMLGILHTDRTARDALALDLMEPVRPMVDRFVLDLFADRELSRRDLFELPDGQCRLMPSLTETLAATTPRWARLTLAVAQSLAKKLDDAAHAHAPKPKHHAEAPRWWRGRPQVRVMREFERRPDPTTDPRYQRSAIRKRQRTMDGVYRANAAWSSGRSPQLSRDQYVRDVVPKLLGLKPRQLMAVTGLTNASCSKIRRGLTIPHARHWPTLARLAAGR